jgi:hypothetical protein
MSLIVTAINVSIILYFSIQLHCIVQWVLQTERTNNKERASRQTHTQGNNNNNEGKQRRKNTNGNLQSVTTWKKSSEKKSTLEDGHVGRNM